MDERAGRAGIRMARPNVTKHHRHHRCDVTC